MQLIDEIIALAVDEKTLLSVLLRKCLVLSYRLKNERLKTWAEKELDGYADDDVLPDYRQTHTLSKGLFFSPGWRMEDYAFPTFMLEERHQAIVDTAAFREGIAALQLDPEEKKAGRQWRIPWPPALVALYQNAILKGSILSQAYQEVPGAFIVALNATIRNRVLKFALELQEELGSVGDNLAALPRDRVDQTVIANIFGGHVVIAGRVNEIAQAEAIVVVKGDLSSLTDALGRVGVGDRGDVQALQKALAEDAGTEARPGLGQRTIEWIKGAAFKVASRGGDAALDVAKAQMTAELTRLVSQFLGVA
jgi:hypothetical protein